MASMAALTTRILRGCSLIGEIPGVSLFIQTICMIFLPLSLSLSLSPSLSLSLSLTLSLFLSPDDGAWVACTTAAHGVGCKCGTDHTTEAILLTSAPTCDGNVAPEYQSSCSDKKVAPKGPCWLVSFLFFLFSSFLFFFCFFFLPFFSYFFFLIFFFSFFSFYCCSLFFIVFCSPTGTVHLVVQQVVVLQNHFQRHVFMVQKQQIVNVRVLCFIIKKNDFVFFVSVLSTMKIIYIYYYSESLHIYETFSHGITSFFFVLFFTKHYVLE